MGCVVSTNPRNIQCISIIVCDDVYRDETTKKMVVVGTFNRISTSSLPCLHPRMTVLFSLTNASGVYDLSLSIEHEKSGQTIAEIRGPLEVHDPLAINDVNVVMSNLQFQEDGKYWAELKADGEIIQQRPFFVSLVQPEQQGESDE